MLPEIVFGVVDLILDKAGDLRDLIMDPPVHRDQQLLQMIGQDFLIAPGALCQFVPHFPEQILVFVGESCADDVSVQRDIAALQDVLYLAAGEVHEPVLGTVGTQKIVMLFLLRLVKDHVSRWNSNILSVQNKMTHSCRNIDQLPVYASLGTPGRKLRPVMQLIRSGAQNAERFFCFFKRNSGIVKIS